MPVESTGWLFRGNLNGKEFVALHRFRWARGLPASTDVGAPRGTWIECVIERNGRATSTGSFFTSLRVTANNVEGIARAERTRWKMESDGLHRLARLGCDFDHAFGHGDAGLADLLATINWFAVALRRVWDCPCDRWQGCRDRVVTRSAQIRELGDALHVAS